MSATCEVHSLTSKSVEAVRVELARLQSERRKLEDSISRINIETESLTLSANKAAYRALRHAALHGELAELKACLATSVDVDARSRSGSTALLLGIHRDGNDSALCALLDAGADPNKADFYGNTPLMAAVRPGQINMFRALIEHSKIVELINSGGGKFQ